MVSSIIMVSSIAYGLIAGISVYYIIEGTYLLLSYVGIKNPSAADEVIVDTEEKANDAEAEHFDDEK